MPVSSLCLMLVMFSPLISIGVQISSEGNFLMYGADGKPLPQTNSLKFTEGEWFDRFDKFPSSDGRIAEFHSIYGGFVNARNQEVDESGKKKLYQMFLNSPSRVLIFYPDRPPVLGESQAEPLGMPPTPLSESKINVNFMLLKKTFPNVFEVNMALPFFHQYFAEMSPLSTQIVGISSKLAYASDNTDINKTLALFTPEINGETQEEFKQKLSEFIADFIVLGKESLMEGNLRETNSNEMEKRNELTNIVKEKMEAKTELLDLFFQQLIYFSHKSLRKFFFGKRNDMIRELFSNYGDLVRESGQPDLNALISNNLMPIMHEVMFDISRMEDLEQEATFEVVEKATYDRKISDEENEKKAFWHKRYALFTAFENLVAGVQEEFPGEIEKFNFEYFKSVTVIDNLDNLKGFFGVFTHSLLPAYYAKYIDYVLRDCLVNSNVFKRLKIADFSTPEGLSVLRNLLMIMGVLDTDLRVDEVKYFDANIFVQGRRNLRLV